jgi:reactive intermediate/imine deaminase
MSQKINSGAVSSLKTLRGSYITGCYIVPGLPHPLLAAGQNLGYQRLRDAYASVRAEIENSDAEMILYLSTQWMTVLGYFFQADPEPQWTLVDHNWHEMGSIPYHFKVDTEFAKHASAEMRELGHYTREVNYRGFPIDTGTVVAQKLLNPENRLKAAMVSCNMYAEKQETLSFGQAMMRALEKHKKRTVVVCVTGLSSRYHTQDIPFSKDRFSSLKDDEWNRKLIEILGEGRLEDVSEVGREFSRQANADMGFRGFWWLNGLCGKSNDFKAKHFAYEPCSGTGALVMGLYPNHPLVSIPGWVNDEADLVERIVSTSDGRKNDMAGSSANSLSDGESEDNKIESKVEKARSGFDEATRSRTLGTSTGFSNESGAGISTKRAPPPVGPYPHARVEGDMIYLSGCGPRSPDSKDIPGVTLDSNGEILKYDVEVQTRAVFENIKTVLAACDATLDDVVDVQAYLTNMKADFSTFNRVYGDYFGKNGLDLAPCRTTIEVGALPTPIAVELKVTARRRH